MSILSRAMQALAPIAPLAAATAAQHGSEMKRVLDDFQQERADSFATLADRAGRRGAQLAEAQRERDLWRRYAHECERRLMAAGLDIPPGPDDEV